MGITVDMFCKMYKANSKAKDDTFEKFMEKHITTKYVDYMTKCVHCDSIVKASCHVKDGDREFIKINSTTRYLFFVMKIIQLYTDIEFKDEDVIAAYDKLNEIGAIGSIIASIPESEYSEFSTLLNMKVDDFRDNEYSLEALLYNFKESFTLSEEIVNEAIKEITKQVEENK